MTLCSDLTFLAKRAIILMIVVTHGSGVFRLPCNTIEATNFIYNSGRGYPN